MYDLSKYGERGVAWDWRRCWLCPGYDWRGRMRYFLGREADPAQCIPAGVDPRSAERALQLVWDAFGIPHRQRYCLRPEDELLAIYRSINPQGWPDCMEFETLQQEIEDLLGRRLTESEGAELKTVGDIVGSVTFHL